MSYSVQKVNKSAVGAIIAALIGGPWLEIVADLWKLGKKLWRGLADEGMYEVLEHDVVLELKDTKGKRALVRKRQKVRYLQNNIIAYQDQAWGDGRILINYHCTPGFEADRYESGHKTQILISLREVKEKEEEDEFNIEWEHLNGFLKSVEEWGSEISHRTKTLKLQVIFPKHRPPKQVFIVEHLRRRTTPVDPDSIRELPKGKWAAVWEIEKPRLHEQYGFKWNW